MDLRQVFIENLFFASNIVRGFVFTLKHGWNFQDYLSPEVYSSCYSKLIRIKNHRS